MDFLAGKIFVGTEEYWFRQYADEFGDGYRTAFGPVVFRPYSQESRPGLLSQEEVAEEIKRGLEA